MVLGNPHLPWDGDGRLYQAHLTIPGEMDVAGATFIGVPLVVIGHTRGLAWSHTTSSAFRFTPFELQLVPGDPHDLPVDGAPKRDDEPHDRGHRAPRRRLAEPVTRTLWSTEYGPVLTELLGLPLFPWTPRARLRVRRRQRREPALPQPLLRRRPRAVGRRARRRSLRAPPGHPVGEHGRRRRGRARALRRRLGRPARDRRARRDVQHRARRRRLRAAAPAGARRLARRAARWGDGRRRGRARHLRPAQPPVPDARRLRARTRNDSYWLSQPRARRSRASRGSSATSAPSARCARGSALRMVRERRPRSTSRAPGAAVQRPQRRRRADARRARRRLPAAPPRRAAARSRRRCVRRARALGRPRPARQPRRAPVPPLGGARAGSRRCRAPNAVGGGAPAAGTWSDALRPERARSTPRQQLNTASPTIRQALGDAVADLREARHPARRPARRAQSEQRGEERIPIHGGPGDVGVFNAITTPLGAGARATRT